MQRRLLNVLLLTMMASAQAGTQIPHYEMTPSTTIPSHYSGAGITTWRSISQAADGVSTDNVNYGFVGEADKTGKISFEFANIYDVDGMYLWNDVAVNNTGIRTFTLEFYDIQGVLIGTAAGPFTAVSKDAVQTYSFSKYKNVKRVDVVISKIASYAEAREIAFTGTRSANLDVTPEIANDPIPLDNLVNPNVLIIMDNSQSMDALMEGSLVSGNFRDNTGRTTRSNIGRWAIRNAITKYQDKFNWGLMTFDLSNSLELRNTYLYLMGKDSTMNFTDTCTGYVAGQIDGPPLQPGTSGGKPCVANPQDAASISGDKYITYGLSSDDSSVLDALYFDSYTVTSHAPQYWWVARNCNDPYTTYDWWTSRNTTTPTTSWTDGSPKTASCSASNANLYYINKNDAMKNPNFFDATKTNANRKGASSPSATDAGFIAGNYSPNYVSRMLFLPRGWGYQANITGAGKLNEPIEANSTTHIDDLLKHLGYETPYASSNEIKNGAIYTPITGALNSAKSYFEGSSSPVSYSCQENAVILVTDGLPTGKTDGTMYSSTARTHSCVWDTSLDKCSGGSFGSAVTDAGSAINALHSVYKASGSVTGNFDVKTYVIAVADAAKNTSHLSAMNYMAYQGQGLTEALLATDATTFASAMENIANNIVSREGAGSVSVMKDKLGNADNFIYQASYKAGSWSGDIEAYQMDAHGEPTGSAKWKAQDKISAMTASERKIVTSTDTAGAIGGVAFAWAASSGAVLSSAQKALLASPGKADGQDVLNFLRGDRSKEKTVYRERTGLLGDIVNAEPVVVLNPKMNYAESGYSSFRGTTRTAMLYQAANDGMVHAINAQDGKEVWAFVPNMVIKDLNNLSRSAGAFVHRPYVDATAEAGDVNFGNVYSKKGTASWRTILVGGLGKGGRGYYALDVTDPNVTTQQGAISRVLWEFPNSISNSSTRSKVTSNVGYSFGKPVIVKLKDSKYGWVILVTSGYSNGNDTGGDGKGYLYVLDAKTGDLIQAIATPACHSGDMKAKPCGLAHIAPYVAKPSDDNTAEFVYGGDLYGNVWKFDLSHSDSTKWSATQMAYLTDGTNPQPITTKPQATSLQVSNNNYTFVYVGTGRYLGVDDVSDKQKQTMYGLIDKGSSTAIKRSDLVVQTLQSSGSKKRKATSNKMDFAKSGWLVDLPDSGERINTPPMLSAEFGVIAFMSNVPSITPCSPGGYSWLNVLDYLSGGFADSVLEESSYQYDDIAVGILAYRDGDALVFKPGLSKKPLTIEKVSISYLKAGKVFWREIVK